MVFSGACKQMLCKPHGFLCRHKGNKRIGIYFLAPPRFMERLTRPAGNRILRRRVQVPE
jgi:hypothetical protein